MALGEVYLVGAGPGDPDLLTFRAVRLMQKADVVLHDGLVSQEVLDLVPPRARRIDVGKRCGDRAMSQEQIEALMIRFAREGNRVLRLKGGDPFVFGRGGEEMEALREAGIRYQIVPGITAAAGCAASVGIPLTHRDLASTCIFVTGHGAGGTLDLDWEGLARTQQTVVVYMGLGNVAEIALKMIAAGAEPHRPAAIIVNGTRPDEHVIPTTLVALPKAAQRVPPGAPSLIVIGEVARFARLQRLAPISTKAMTQGPLPVLTHA